MRRFTPLTWMAFALAAIVVVGLLYVYATRDGGSANDRLGNDIARAETGDRPEKRCSSPRTYDAIKRELFRRAAATRGADRSAFDQVAAYSSLRVESPLLKDRDSDIGTLNCSARIALDLPPGTEVVGGRRTLSADIDYVLQQATDGSGDVVMIEGADPITVPLATLARVGGATTGPIVAAPAPDSGPIAEPRDTAADDSPPPPPERPPVISPPPPPPVAQRPAASPSFNCRNARTRGEIAVCGDPRLATLDRQMASQYVRAVSGGSAEQRALLSRTRGEFLRHRDSCPNDACIAETYRGRMREISD
ncbi:MAG TPA: hypothetical protein VFO42_02780, partial [Sphingomicrobium sp.]|nr:hypothetical protein [Sphingomicrobium sp.]